MTLGWEMKWLSVNLFIYFAVRLSQCDSCRDRGLCLSSGVSGCLSVHECDVHRTDLRFSSETIQCILWAVSSGMMVTLSYTTKIPTHEQVYSYLLPSLKPYGTSLICDFFNYIFLVCFSIFSPMQIYVLLQHIFTWIDGLLLSSVPSCLLVCLRAIINPQVNAVDWWTLHYRILCMGYVINLSN